MQEMAVTRVEQFRFREPRSRKWKSILAFPRVHGLMVAGRRNHCELRRTQNRTRSGVANVGELRAIGREAGCLDAASCRIDGDDCVLFAGGKTDGFNRPADDARAAYERDACSVRRPRGLKLVGVAACDLLQRASCDVDGPDIVAAFEGTVRGKSNSRAIRRDAWLTVITMAGGDLLPSRAIGKHRPDVKCSPRVGLDGDDAAFR